MDPLKPGEEARYVAPLLRRAWFSERAFEVALERPKTFEFVPGQNVRLSAGGQERDYSMASGPADSCLSFCVSRVEGGTVSSALWGVPMGSPFAFTGPHGLFTIRESPRRAVWAATGVGIAPFLSMVRAGATGFTLLQGARRFGDLLHRQELEAAASRYVPCLSREAADGCYSGRVTRWAGARLEPGVYDFYLCGMRSMIRDFIRIVDERFPDSRVYTEIFF